MSPVASSTSSCAEPERSLQDESCSFRGSVPLPSLRAERRTEGAKSNRGEFLHSSAGNRIAAEEFVQRLRITSLLFAALFACLAIGCGDSDKSDVTVATTTPASGARATSTSDKPSKGVPTSVSGNAQTSNESVSFSTSDGTTIKGHFYSAPGPKRRALIIASLGEQKTWGAYASQLANQGIALLTFDMRGVGETGGAKNDAQLDKDIEVAVNLVKSRDYPLVYVFGAGADAALAAMKVAARNDLAGLATYSASAAGRTDIANVKEPKLLLANENNNEASAALSTLANAAPDPVRRVALASNPPAADPLSAADARLALIDFVLGK